VNSGLRPGGGHESTAVGGTAAGADAADTGPLLRVRDLVVRFHTETGPVYAVNGISWTLSHGEALAVVGESGAGKTVAMLSLLGLLPATGRVEGGEALFRGRDLLRLSPAELRDVRGRDIAMIFQDPATSLNPVLTVGRQITEGLRYHLGASAAEARARAVELLDLVGIANPGARLADHPHELSGGQRQRVMIAMALACGPAVLVADEPTTALDVTIQAQIVDLVKRLQAELGMAIVWITHDLALVAGLVDRVVVMYAGTVVENAPVADLYARPSHPYTRGLLRSVPTVEPERRKRLRSIDGAPPDLREQPAGCPFAPRCAWAEEHCRRDMPPLATVAEEHRSACWRWRDLDALEAGRRGP
jgi:oligopeptide/dipeptide ABC transporter ATP-binding protein